MSHALIRKIAEAHAILDDAIESFVVAESKELAGVCILFSGGNDSTVLAHLMRDRATHMIHCNTGIGIEQTRHFVRQVAALFQLPLLEMHPPSGSSYRDLVLDQGFPGPGMHYKMYQRLKERGLRAARKQLVSNGRRQRVVFLAGRRRAESKRRMSIPEREREGSVVWVSPLVNWTSEDMQAYRDLMGDVPRNEVSDMLHMSGECLCGAFAHVNELDEIEFFFPHVAQEIRSLEHEVLATGKFEPRKCKWGWGATEPIGDDDVSGPLCDACDVRRIELVKAGVTLMEGLQ